MKAVVVSMIALAVAGCSVTTQGVPQAGDADGQGPTSEPSTRSTTSETSPVQQIPDALMNPCELLTEAEVRTLGASGGVEDEVVDSVGCEWRVQKATAADSYTLGVVYFETVGLEDIVADGETTPIQVGSREGVQSIRSAGGGCAISIPVTETSRVDVGVFGRDGAALCSAALEVAELVEPKVP